VAVWLGAGAALAETVAVREPEGLVHGFLSLSTLDGKILADGDLFQTVRGDRVTSRLLFRFRDGSTSEETSVYTQTKQFRLVSNRVVQKGPAFPRPFLDSTIDVPGGRVTVRYKDEDGKEEKTIDEKMELPEDLANGLILTLLKNLSPQTPKTVVSMLAIQPKLRLVKLEFTPLAKEPFRTGGLTREATRYNVKVDVGGVTGVLASLLDKAPPDSSVWILGGDAPAFVRSESPLFVGGPQWRIELVSPSWSEKPAASDKKGDDKKH
jgi:hypothetical protein